MNNLKILLKNNLNLLLGKLQGKKQRKSTAVALCLLVLGIVGILCLYTLQAYSMFAGLGASGLGELCLFHGFLTSLSVVLIIGIMRVSGNPKNNDDDLLLSLPIKKRDIIISKTVNKYLFDFFFSSVLLLPYVVLYCILDTFSAGILLKGIFCVFTLPLLSVGISYIFDFIITRLFNKLSCGKLLKSLVSVFIYIIIMALLLLKTSFYGGVDPSNMQAYFADLFFSNLFLNFVLTNSLKYYIGVILVVFVPFVIGMLLYSFNYGKTFSGYKGNSRGLKYTTSKSIFGKILKKEIVTYGTTTPWIVNTIIGPILMLVFSTLIAITGYDKLVAFISPKAAIPLDYCVAMLCLIFCFFIATTLISCASISLEGKSIWLLKSSPVSEKQLFLAKGCLQVILLEPVLLISSIILTIALKLTFLNFLTIFVLPTLLILILSFGGVLINILYPVFDFDDETKVVKQSLAVFLTMLLGYVLTAGLVGIYFLFSFLSLTYIMLICSLVYLILLTVILILLFTVGVKKFREMSL